MNHISVHCMFLHSCRMVQSFPVYLVSSTKGEKNTPSYFTVRYPKKFEFNSSWTVALTSLIYPRSWPVVGTDEQQYIDVTWNDGHLTRIELDPTTFKTVDQLVDGLQKIIVKKSSHDCIKRGVESDDHQSAKRARRQVSGENLTEVTKLKDRVRELKWQRIEDEKQKEKEIQSMSDKILELESAKEHAQRNNEEKVAVLQQRIERLEKQKSDYDLKINEINVLRSELGLLKDVKLADEERSREQLEELRARLAEEEKRKSSILTEKQNKITILERQVSKATQARTLLEQKAAKEVSNLEDRLRVLEMEKANGGKAHDNEINLLRSKLAELSKEREERTQQAALEVQKLQRHITELVASKNEKEEAEKALQEQLSQLSEKAQLQEIEKVRQINGLMEKLQILENEKTAFNKDTMVEMEKYKSEIYSLKQENIATGQASREEINHLQETIRALQKEKTEYENGRNDEVKHLKNRISELDDALKRAVSEGNKKHTQEPESDLSDIDVYAMKQKDIAKKKQLTLVNNDETSNECIEDNRLDTYVRFTYDELKQHVKLHINKDHIRTVQLSEQLEYVLGFDHRAHDQAVNEAMYMPDLHGGVHTLYIYAPSLVEPSLVGDTAAPLLGIVSVKGKPNDVVQETFLTPHYHKILEKQIGEISIEIRTSTGRLVPFNWGETTLVLDFKKQSVF